MSIDDDLSKSILDNAAVIKRAKQTGKNLNADIKDRPENAEKKSLIIKFLNLPSSVRYNILMKFGVANEETNNGQYSKAFEFIRQSGLVGAFVIAVNKASEK